MSASSTFAEDLSPSECDDGERHERELQLQDKMHNSIAFHAEMMGNIMYFHQALKFVQTVVKEVNGHTDNKHWELIKHSNVSQNVEIVPSVWAMPCKHNLTISEITKSMGEIKHLVSTTSKPFHQ